MIRAALPIRLSQVVEAAAPDFAPEEHHHLVDVGGMDGKDALHPHAIRDLAHRKAGPGEAAPFPDDHSLEDLDALLVPFHNAYMHFHGIPGAKRRQVAAHLLPG